MILRCSPICCLTNQSICDVTKLSCDDHIILNIDIRYYQIQKKKSKMPLPLNNGWCTYLKRNIPILFPNERMFTLWYIILKKCF